MNTKRSSLAGIMTLAIAAVLAGCGGSGTGALPSTGGGPAGAIDAGGSPPAGGGPAGGGAVDVCQIVTQADVAPFFTSPMTAEEDTSQTGQYSQCIYQVATHDGLPPMEIYVVHGDQAATAYGSFTGGNSTHLPLSGIGDQAERTPGTASFAAIKGSTFCTVQLGAGNGSHYAGLPSPDPDGTLPDAGAEAYALRLAALCVKIFAASGA
jgi:hypothetical protein